MPSGKASKKKRRVPPPPVKTSANVRRGVSGPGRQSRQASPKVLAAVAGTVVVIAIVIVVVAVSGGGGGSTPPARAVGSLSGALPEAASVQALFNGIPQHGTVLGDPSAPVTMQEFIDPQCPYCREFETTVLPSLVQDYVRTGKVKIKMEPWAFIGPASVVGQAAELAAGLQNRAFNYAEVLYFNQRVENTGWLNTSMVTAAAESIPGLKVNTLLSQRNGATVKSEQLAVDTLANVDKVTGTPTIYVGRSGVQGTYVNMSSATDAGSVIAAIKAAGG